MEKQNYTQSDILELLETTQKEFSQDDTLDMDAKYLLQQTLWADWYKEHVKSWVLLILNLHEKIQYLDSQDKLNEIDKKFINKVKYETEQMYKEAEKVLESEKIYSLVSFLKQWSPSNYLQELIDDLKE